METASKAYPPPAKVPHALSGDGKEQLENMVRVIDSNEKLTHFEFSGTMPTQIFRAIQDIFQFADENLADFWSDIITRQSKNFIHDNPERLGEMVKQAIIQKHNLQSSDTE